MQDNLLDVPLFRTTHDARRTCGSRFVGAVSEISPVCLLQACGRDYSGETLIHLTDAMFEDCASSASGGAMFIKHSSVVVMLICCS